MTSVWSLFFEQVKLPRTSEITPAHWWIICAQLGKNISFSQGHRLYYTTLACLLYFFCTDVLDACLRCKYMLKWWNVNQGNGSIFDHIIPCGTFFRQPIYESSKCVHLLTWKLLCSLLEHCRVNSPSHPDFKCYAKHRWKFSPTQNQTLTEAMNRVWV